ncbi:putative disease resistance RPP13-like protein 1 [Cinnamomum micranthum f. kanehirae]|uniref:Putative disease resistance RPP13-like protein 1 n=1 Tax=Cinnamomum micranthum f. kanehirae TaxID=337451 RepID=A0A3S3P2N5_9MAGN|nr:putative disease resistance RPP13-like protein 1 [Cinnamomum micranthum f. kanehirae]
MDSAISKVADAGLSALFQAMFDTLTPNFLQSLGRLGFLFVGVEGEAKKLEKTLSRIQAHLNDAEARQIREESVRLWLSELKDAAYDAEDIVDEVKYQVLLRPKIEGAQMQTRKRKLIDSVSDFASSSSSNLKGSQLRYLDLSYTNIERLPESTTRLYNLQTLNLSECLQLAELPSDLSNLVNLRHLHPNSSSVSIPPRIGTLKGLQTLSNFIVGKEIGRGINELKDLIHLRGSLCISELENVVNVEEAKEAQLKNKQKIDRLELKWKCDNVESRQEGIEEEVLNALQPHTNLKQLEIEGYCGVRFPTWLGDSSFSKLTHVTLSKCRCRLLPPFGRLPSLQYLTLEDLHGLEKVGREFYGDGTVTGFPPLEELSFNSVPDLEELSGLGSDIRHIREIVISNCTKLSLSSLRYLTSLSSLTIRDCSNITSLGNGLQHLTSLQSLVIDYCLELTSLTCLPKGLQRLLLICCPKIHSLPEERSTTLSYLEISMFPNITSLPNGLQHLTSLQSLKISYCPKLTSLTNVDLPATLDDGLGNSNYSNPTCLPKGLQKLTLENCPKISSLPEELLTTLRCLYIDRCPLLEEKYLVLAEGGNGYRCKISDIPNITFEVFLTLALNLPASAAIITSSCYNHQKQPLPLLSSPFHSRKQSHWMDAIAVDEAIWHGMKISEVDETRSVFRNLKSVIYEIKLQPMLGIHIPFIFVWIKPGVYVAHIL